MAKCIKIEGVSFFPYCGIRYRESRLRLLILGESHYGPDRNSDQSETTLEAIQSGEYRFFETIRHRIGPCFHGETDFWEEVAFYNYVQKLAGTEARTRPSDEMWAFSHVAFGKVLRALKPTRILVLGKTTWLNMADEEQDSPGCNAVVEPRFRLGRDFGRNTPKGFRYACWYSTSQRTYALAAGIFHPAHPRGFYRPETTRVIKMLMNPNWKAPSTGLSAVAEHQPRRADFNDVHIRPASSRPRAGGAP